MAIYKLFPIPVSGVSLNKSSIVLANQGDTETLTATISPANAEDTAVSWSSSDTNIATVTPASVNTATVYCVSPGSCDITVTTHDGGFTATCGVSDGSGWQPGADTVAYYPFTSITTISDMNGSGTTYDLTNRGNVAFGTYTSANVDCAYFDGSLDSQLYNTDMTFAAYPTQTVLMRVYISGTNSSVYQTLYHTGLTGMTGKLGAWFKYNTGLCIGSWYGGYESIKPGNINGAWHLIVDVTNGTSSNQYLDGGNAPYQGFTNNLSGTMSSIYVGGEESGSGRLTGYISNLIVEKKVWSIGEIVGYYEQTKGNYGIS